MYSEWVALPLLRQPPVIAPDQRIFRPVAATGGERSYHRLLNHDRPMWLRFDLRFLSAHVNPASLATPFQSLADNHRRRRVRRADERVLSAGLSTCQGAPGFPAPKPEGRWTRTRGAAVHPPLFSSLERALRNGAEYPTGTSSRRPQWLTRTCRRCHRSSSDLP